MAKLQTTDILGMEGGVGDLLKFLQAPRSQVYSEGSKIYNAKTFKGMIIQCSRDKADGSEIITV